MVARYLTVVILTTALSACSLFKEKAPEVRYVTRVVTTEVPIPYVPPAPTELTNKPTYPIPVFMDPAGKDVVVGLTSEGTRDLKELISQLKGRLDAWHVWYTTVSNDKVVH